MATQLRSNDGVGLYVHVPFCERKCAYCGFYSEAIGGQDVGAVVGAMLVELDRLWLGGEAETIYVGGGSPSCLAREDLERLLRGVVERVGEGVEFTVEVNPGQVTLGGLKALRGWGVNRLSIGGQSFDDGELELLGRVHKAEAIGEAVRMARKAGFDNVSVDLIFALPGQGLAVWEESLRKVMALGVEHVSAYSLSYEKETVLWRRLEAGEVAAADEELDRSMYEMAIDLLEAGGWGQYEISNFAKAGRECKHNLRYWNNDDYLGIGPAAGSCWAGRRWSNEADIKGYVAAMDRGEPAVSEMVCQSATEIACETAVLNLRRRVGIDYEEFRKRTGFEARELFAKVIEQQCELGLLEADEQGVRLTRAGLPIADTVLMEFAGLE